MSQTTQNNTLTLFHIRDDEYNLGLYTLEDMCGFIRERYYNEYIENVSLFEENDCIGKNYNLDKLEDLTDDDLRIIVNKLGFYCNINLIENDIKHLIEFFNSLFVGDFH